MILLVLVVGLLVGLAPPPGLPALWLGTLGYTAIALWLIVRSHRWATAIYVAVTCAGSFSVEWLAVHWRGILTHDMTPRFGGVSLMGVLQDFSGAALALSLAAALFPAGKALTRAVVAGALMFVADLVASPCAAWMGYYTYYPPFFAWPASLGLDRVPAVPWDEPLGMAGMVFLTTAIFEMIRRRLDLVEKPFSLRWTALAFGCLTFPHWSWAAHHGHWGLFALDTALLTAVAVLVAWRCLAGSPTASALPAPALTAEA